MYAVAAKVPGLPEVYPKIWAPEIEVFERDAKFVVRVDLPGLTKEDVKIEVAHDELRIEGERKFEKEEKKEGLHRTDDHSQVHMIERAGHVCTVEAPKAFNAVALEFLRRYSASNKGGDDDRDGNRE